jgi:hypothetical protein
VDRGLKPPVQSLVPKVDWSNRSIALREMAVKIVEADQIRAPPATSSPESAEHRAPSCEIAVSERLAALGAPGSGLRRVEVVIFSRVAPGVRAAAGLG